VSLSTFLTGDDDGEEMEVGRGSGSFRSGLRASVGRAVERWTVRGIARGDEACMSAWSVSRPVDRIHLRGRWREPYRRIGRVEEEEGVSSHSAQRQGPPTASPGIETDGWCPLVDQQQHQRRQPVPSLQDDRPRDLQAGMWWRENYRDEVCLISWTVGTRTK
jgi:hypothetical protein